jgi:hypothetical protein
MSTRLVVQSGVAVVTAQLVSIAHAQALVAVAVVLPTASSMSFLDKSFQLL